MIINAGRRTIDAGYQNDNNATTVAFDISKYIEEYGTGTWGVRIMRANDPDGYPSTHFTVDDDVLYYTFTSGDCAQAGMGEIQLSLAASDGVVKMSKVYYFYVNESLGTTTTPPDPWQDYITTIQGYAQRAEAACGYYPRIATDTGNWEVYSVATGNWVDTGVHAKGDKGDPGEAVVNIGNSTNVGGIVMDKNGAIAKAVAGTDYLEPSALTAHNADVTAHSAALASYSLISNTGSKIDLFCDTTTYKLYANLYDANNNEISRSTVIDLPIESLIMNVYYDAATKELVVTYKSGTQARIPIGDIISGLATQDWVRAYHDPSKADASDLTSHTGDTSNPHSVTAAQVGLGNVDNTADVDKPVSTATQTALNTKANASETYTKSETDALLDEKVDIVEGKGLSTNDYTTAEKNKLDGIADGAEVNVQSDFTQTDTAADDYIKNKPTALSDFTDDLTGRVKYDEAQSLTEAQKIQARANIGAGSADGDMSSSVYDPNAHASDIFAYADSAVSTHNAASNAHSTLFAAKADAADLDAVEEKIPAQATSSNQLADKAFVNSSISTETAHYISNNGQPFTSVAQLEAYSGTVTNNDYAFVTGTDESGNTYYDRYKASVSGATITWAKEYRLNNSAFTAAQWSAVNSGITAALVSDINSNTAVRHSHDNKSVLDGITSALISAWNTASTWVTTNGANVLSHLSDTVIHVTSGDKTAWNAKTTVSVSSTGSSTDEVQYITVDGVEKKLAGGDEAAWGNITGTLSNQADLQAALDAKQNDVVVSASEPATSSDGDMWFDTDADGSELPIIVPTDVAAAFSSSTTYSIGDLCVYNGEVYRFTEAHPAGAWVGTDAVITLLDAAFAKSSTLSTHTNNVSNPHGVTATQVGLGNVDNTADTDKPISTATQTALDNKVDKVTGKGLSTNDYDDTEKENVASNTSARHSHSNKALLDTYTQTEVNLASAVSHVSNTSNPHSVTAAQVGLGNCNNTSDTDKPISTATQTALDAKAARDTDAVSGNLAKFDASGNPIDTGYATNNILGLSYTVVSTWT